MNMVPSPQCYAFIKEFEQFRPTAYAATEKERRKGIWTIAWGHTRGVKEGDICTTAQGEIWLQEDMGWATAAVNDNVRQALTQNEFDALVCFCFNVGEPEFASSTLLQLLNNGAQKALVAGQFARWNKQDGRVLPGLTARRAKETALFLRSA